MSMAEVFTCVCARARGCGSGGGGRRVYVWTGRRCSVARRSVAAGATVGDGWEELRGERDRAREVGGKREGENCFCRC